MSLADIHSSLLAKDRANSPTAAEMLRQHYDLPALAGAQQEVCGQDSKSSFTRASLSGD